MLDAVEKRLKKSWRKLGEKKVLALELHAVLANSTNEVSLPRMLPNLETQRKALMSSVRQQYKSKSIDKAARNERIEALQEKAKAKLMRYLLQEMAGGTKTTAEDLIFAEWESHMDQVFQDFESLKNAAPEKIAKEKRVTLRWLDKRDDLIECFRFADSAQCCFNSKNYRIGGHEAGAAEWIVRVWKDPLSYIFQIEDSPGNAIGFVFGGFGGSDGKLTVMLNGVYMEGKTDTAAQSLLNSLEADFSRALEASIQMVAARYGGTSKFGKGYSNTPAEVKRFRALMGLGRSPETEIYDDLNVGVNEPGTTDSNVWHKELK